MQAFMHVTLLVTVKQKQCHIPLGTGPIDILIVSIPSDQISQWVVIHGENASGELEIVNMLHSGDRNPFVLVPTGKETY